MKTEFAAVKNIENIYDVVTTNARFYIKNGDGKVLFGLKEKETVHTSNPGWVSVMLKVISIVFLLIFINLAAYEVVKKRGWIWGFLLLTGPVLLLRYISYKVSFPFDYRSLELFDASIYASNRLHPSLGDLLVNMILLFWLISFFKFSAINHLQGVRNTTGKRGWMIIGALSVLTIILAFTLAGVIRSLIIDSKIPFDVVNFFSLNIYTVISFIILCLIILSFFHLSHFLLLFMHKVSDVPKYIKYVVVTICGLLYLTINVNDPTSISNLIVLCWLLIYMFFTAANSVFKYLFSKK